MATYQFGPFHLEVAERRLLRDGTEIRLRSKVFDTLHVLVENAGKLVRKDELLTAVWPDSVVEENNVDHCISSLRRVFEPEKFIETIPRHGYRFVGDVIIVGEALRSHAAAPVVAIDDAEVPEAEIKFFTASDGVNIAYTVSGTGPVLIRTTNWLNHIGFEWENPFQRQWLLEVMKHNTLVRYDLRGCGLSDWSVEDLSFERSVKDFAELADVIGAEKFSICGGCHGAAVATAYATQNPERVSKLVFHGAFANGWPVPGEGSQEQFEAMLTLMRLGWGRDNPAFRQLWTSLFMPDADAAQMCWMNEMQRRSTSPENAVRITKELSRMKILDLLPSVRVPTLVLHSKEDAAVPISDGRLIASRIRGAKLVELQSRSHMVSPGDPAWPTFVENFAAFMEWRDRAVQVTARSQAS